MNRQLVQFIERLIRPFYVRLRTRVLVPFRKLSRFSLEAARAVNKFIRKIIAKREPSIKDYIHLGRYYVAKKLLAFIFIGILIAVYLLAINPPAFLLKATGKPVAFAKQDVLAAHTGPAKIFHENKTLYYEGELTDGKFSGSGKMYDEGGNLIYEGEFAQGLPEGNGISYNELGRAVYRGSFAAGKKNGQGEEYDARGNLLYRGEFAQDVYSGEGMLFYPGELLKYEGSLQNGRPGGMGTEYHLNGEVKYEGNYLAGRYQGFGKLFDTEANLVYEGNFSNGLYAGIGTKYFKNGFIEYTGDFQAGQYSGEGILYHENGARKYKGAFWNGSFNGAGELYNEEALPIYTGNFKDGLFEGLGTLTAPDGTVTFIGFFKEGEIDYTGFLGLSGKRAVEILGEPPAVRPGDISGEEPSGSLVLVYNDYSLALTLMQLEEDLSGHSTVVKVTGWDDPLAFIKENSAGHKISEGEDEAPDPADDVQAEDVVFTLPGFEYLDGTSVQPAEILK